MSGTLEDVYDLLVDQLVEAGLPVVNDSRTVRPPCIIIEPPTITTVPNAFTTTLTYGVYCIAPPPANRDSSLWLMRTADKVIELLDGAQSGEPTTYTISGNEMPAYLINVQLTAYRST